MSDLTAIILCGGKGERLRPFTDAVPKPLVPLNGKPLLYHLMRYLCTGGVRRFVLCLGYKSEAIEQFVHQSAPANWHIKCDHSGDVSMNDRIIHALKHVSGPMIICYGDTLANIDLAGLRAEHQASGALATLTVYPLHSPFGIVDLADGGQVLGIVEKPILPHWINIGFMICDPEATSYLTAGTDLTHFAAGLASAGKLNAYRHQGRHVTVNTEKERTQAEAEMLEFFTVLEN